MNWTNTQRALIVFGLLAFLISAAVAAWAFAMWGFSRAGAVQPTGGIKVTASADVTAAPDVAHITFGVVTRDKVAKDAAARNAEKSSYIVAALAKNGIPRKDIKTVDFSLEAEYNYNVSPARQTGYRASNHVRVKTKDIAKLGELIDAAINAGANDVQNVTFDVEQKAKLRQEALRRAVDAAEGKARAIAEAMDASLGKPISASESVDYRYDYKANLSYDIVRTLPKMKSSAPIMPGETKVTCDVTVTFSIK